MDEQTNKAKLAAQMFTRPGGATMREVIAATGGPQYNKLKQLEALGYAVRKVKGGGETRYFVQAPEHATFSATVTAKGQVTIPRPVRERLHLRNGHRIEFTVEGDNRAVIRPAASRLSDLAGMLGKPKRKLTLTLEKMDEAIRQAAVDRYLRAIGGRRKKR